MLRSLLEGARFPFDALMAQVGYLVLVFIGACGGKG